MFEKSSHERNQSEKPPLNHDQEYLHLDLDLYIGNNIYFSSSLSLIYHILTHSLPFSPSSSLFTPHSANPLFIREVVRVPY
jgi:hypothetical protein